MKIIYQLLLNILSKKDLKHKIMLFFSVIIHLILNLHKKIKHIKKHAYVSFK
jgi:hypothetical protein